MFTGIITDIGSITSVDVKQNGRRFVIASHYPADSLETGQSIACAGVCLTVTEKGSNEEESWFTVDVSEETLTRTTLENWQENTAINLERALKAGDELGGHIVSGHIDGIATIEKTEPIGDNVTTTFSASENLMRFIAEKGSVTLDGVSLTVNGVEKNRFWVNIIPHTLKHTTLGECMKGDKVNLEIDMLARYVSHMLEAKSA